MSRAFALIRARWLMAASYRLQLALSFAALVVSIVPIYFITESLQPVMARSISQEAGRYFGFVLLGMIILPSVTAAVNTLPAEIGGGIKTGTFEALLSTPSSLPTLVTGLLGFDFLWNIIRALAMLVVGWSLGAHIAWGGLPLAGFVFALIVLAYLPFGLIGSALVLVFRTPTPLARAVLYVSVLLGGVYYPTGVVPHWIRFVSGYVPITYGLRAMRRIVLQGAGLPAVASDLSALLLFGVGLAGVGTIAFLWALRYARRTGSLAQY